MEIEVLKPGLVTTIQDLGRIGFGGFGVPKSGAMDSHSAKFANLLLGNEENSAVMEIYLQGPTLKFHGQTHFSVAGPDAEIYLNKNKIPCNKVFQAKGNDVLEILKTTDGSRVYFGVSGGFQTEKTMGSRSMFDGITQNAFLQKGGILKLKSFSKPVKTAFSKVHFDIEAYSGNLLHAFRGPEFYMLLESEKKGLLEREFTITKDANRMACPLEGRLENKLKNILTGPVLPGTVQLTPSGKLIVLMRDCQTTGGYPRVLQLSEKSQNLLAQKRPGNRIGFQFLKNRKKPLLL